MERRRTVCVIQNLDRQGYKVVRVLFIWNWPWEKKRSSSLPPSPVFSCSGICDINLDDCSETGCKTGAGSSVPRSLRSDLWVGLGIAQANVGLPGKSRKLWMHKKALMDNHEKELFLQKMPSAHLCYSGNFLLFKCRKSTHGPLWSSFFLFIQALGCKV